jgi:hypothetical protein
MLKIWKKKFVIVGLAVIFIVFVLFNETFPDKPVVDKTPFIFLFIAYITLFPLVITQERPRFSRWVYQYNRRAPPLFELNL